MSGGTCIGKILSNPISLDSPYPLVRPVKHLILVQAHSSSKDDGAGNNTKFLVATL